MFKPTPDILPLQKLCSPNTFLKIFNFSFQTDVNPKISLQIVNREEVQYPYILPVNILCAPIIVLKPHNFFNLKITSKIAFQVKKKTLYLRDLLP